VECGSLATGGRADFAAPPRRAAASGGELTATCGRNGALRRMARSAIAWLRAAPSRGRGGSA
jgi:hypothetical protein